MTPFNYARNAGINTTTVTTTAPSASVVGDTVVVAIFTHNSSGNTPNTSVTDNAATANIYTPVGATQQVLSGGLYYNVYFFTTVLASTPSVGNLAITATTNGQQGRINVAIVEVTGPVYIDSASVFGNTNTGSGTVSVQTILANNSELVLAAVVAGGTLTAGTGWTMETASSSNETLFYEFPANLGIQNPTIATLTSSYWAAVVIGISPTPITAPTQIASHAGKLLPVGIYELRTYYNQTSGAGFVENTASMQSSYAWNDTRIHGVSIRINWSSIQPTSATNYNWSYIDAALALAQSTGKGLGIAVRMGFYCPSWVLNSVTNTFSSNSTQTYSSTLTNGSPTVTMSSTDGISEGMPVTGTGIPSNTIVNSVDSETQIELSNNATAGGTQTLTIGGPTNYPLPWDPAYQLILGNFISAFAQRYDSNPNVTFVDMSGLGWGDSMQFCQSSTDNTNFQLLSWNGAGAVQAWIDTFQTVGNLWLKYFQNTAVVTNFADPLQGVIPQVNGQAAVTTFQTTAPFGRWGIKYNNLTGGNGSRGIVPTQIISSTSGTSPVGFQYQHANPNAGGGYAAGLSNALAAHGHFLEVYDSDVSADPLSGPLASANATMLAYVGVTEYATFFLSPTPIVVPSVALPSYKSTSHQSVLYSVTRKMGIDPKVTLTTPVAEAYLTYIDERCREAWEKFDWTDLVIYEQRAFEDPWQSSVNYNQGQTVFDWSSMLYWTSLVGNNLNNPPATSPTFWGTATLTAPFIIPTNQVTYDEIGTVLDVTAVDPRAFTNPNRVGWERIQSGIVLYPDRVFSDSTTPFGPLLIQGAPIPGQIVGFSGKFPTTVWLTYRIPYPGFATSYYSDSNTYNIGDRAFFGTDTFKSLSVQTGQSPSVSPSTWQIISFPYVLSEFVKKAAWVDALSDDGQHEKAGLEEPRAYACLDREYDKQILQQGQQSFYTVSGV